MEFEVRHGGRPSVLGELGELSAASDATFSYTDARIQCVQGFEKLAVAALHPLSVAEGDLKIHKTLFADSGVHGFFFLDDQSVRSYRI